MQYKLNIIPGTIEFVLKELQAKFPDTEILDSSATTIEFQHEATNVDQFRELKSALHITKAEGITRNLFRRDWQTEYVPAGINPALAYVVCMLADITESDTVLDPFCGAGTIAVTAAKYFSPHKVLASDVSGKAVDKTIINFRGAAIPTKKFTVFRSNVAQLRLQKDSVNLVITNPPFGVRTGNHEQNKKIYDQFARRMQAIVAPGGRIVVLTQEKKLLTDVMFRQKFNLIAEHDIRQGGLIPRVFIFGKNR